MFLLVAAVIGSLLECASVGIFQPFVELFMDQQAVHKNPYLEYIWNLWDFRSFGSFMSAMAIAIIAIFVIKNIYDGGARFETENGTSSDLTTGQMVEIWGTSAADGMQATQICIVKVVSD